MNSAGTKNIKTSLEPNDENIKTNKLTQLYLKKIQFKRSFINDTGFRYHYWDKEIAREVAKLCPQTHDAFIVLMSSRISDKYFV